jgi:hypothetical protein
MKNKSVPAIVIVAVLLAFLGSMALAAQDRFTLKSPNGISYSEFKGYETWQERCCAFQRPITGRRRPLFAKNIERQA